MGGGRGGNNDGVGAGGGGGRGNRNGGNGNRDGDGNGNENGHDINGDWNRLVDGKAGLAPANNTTTSAWTMDDEEDGDDVIPLKGIRVQKDLEQNMQRGLRPGMAV